ncbi:MAG: hypothetical protein WCX32_04000 [Clostridia bacterium]|jgi:hypothetical protein|nr:hypothetical protein [Clostridia bacterium]MDD4275737.1 hypothetical protein [Clostridia bacterium]
MLIFNDYSQLKKYYNENKKTFIFTEHGELADIEINFEIPPYLSKTLNILANDVSSSCTLIGKNIDCNNLECPNLDFGHIDCNNITNVESISAISIQTKKITNVGTITCTRIKCDYLNAIEVKVVKKATLGIANVDTLQGLFVKSQKTQNGVMKLTVNAEKIVCKTINIFKADKIGEIFFEDFAVIGCGEFTRKIEGNGKLIAGDITVGAMLFTINEDESEKIIYTDVDYSENDSTDYEIGLVKCPIIKVTSLEAKNVMTELFNVQMATVSERLICKDESFGNCLNAKVIYLNKGGIFNQISSDKLTAGGKLEVRKELSIKDLRFDQLIVDTAEVDEMSGNYIRAGSVIASNIIRVTKIDIGTVVSPKILTDCNLLKVETCEGEIIDKTLKSDINEYTA